MCVSPLYCLCKLATYTNHMSIEREGTHPLGQITVRDHTWRVQRSVFNTTVAVKVPEKDIIKDNAHMPVSNVCAFIVIKMVVWGIL